MLTYANITLMLTYVRSLDYEHFKGIRLPSVKEDTEQRGDFQGLW